LIQRFHSLITDFNKKSEFDKIELKPSFYASSHGLQVIIGLTSFLGFAVILCSIISKKSIPVTFVFSVILIIHLWIRRKRELFYYKRLAKSESRSS
jgi:hypothetical protein